MIAHGSFIAFLYAGLHECIHKSAFKNKKLNEFVGYFIGFVLMRSFLNGRYRHMAHHTFTQHPEKDPDKVAIIWESDSPNESKKITYKELLENVCKVANALKEIGVKKGDRVTIYLTMVPELAYTMLACSRIGAIHSIIFGGFSSESISGRIIDCKSEYLVTAYEGVRGGKIIPLKKIADDAMEKSEYVKKCLVVKELAMKCI